MCQVAADDPLKQMQLAAAVNQRMQVALSESFVQVAPKFHFIISFFFAQISRKFWRNLVV